MRTKTVFLTAALVAAGALSSMAQSNVYSLNVVGYINLSLTNGFQLIANQLDLDGTGTNNTLASVFSTNLPNLTKVYDYNSASAVFNGVATYLSSSGSWIGDTADANKAVNPGSGIFLSIPATATAPTITTVGTVLQGTLTTPYVAGFNLVSSQVPIAAGAGALGLTNNISNLDVVYQFDAATQLYGAKHTYLTSSGSWLGGEPQIAIGEAFWYDAKNPGNWTVTFNVQ
jgi:hypothetical protein